MDAPDRVMIQAPGRAGTTSASYLVGCATAIALAWWPFDGWRPGVILLAPPLFGRMEAPQSEIRETKDLRRCLRSMRCLEASILPLRRI